MHCTSSLSTGRENAWAPHQLVSELHECLHVRPQEEREHDVLFPILGSLAELVLREHMGPGSCVTGCRTRVARVVIHIECNSPRYREGPDFQQQAKGQADRRNTNVHASSRGAGAGSCLGVSREAQWGTVKGDPRQRSMRRGMRLPEASLASPAAVLRSAPDPSASPAGTKQRDAGGHARRGRLGAPSSLLAGLVTRRARPGCPAQLCWVKGTVDRW